MHTVRANGGFQYPTQGCLTGPVKRAQDIMRLGQKQIQFPSSIAPMYPKNTLTANFTGIRVPLRAPGAAQKNPAILRRRGKFVPWFGHRHRR
jgi:hypothetical protein